VDLVAEDAPEQRLLAHERAEVRRLGRGLDVAAAAVLAVDRLPGDERSRVAIDSSAASNSRRARLANL
jgi:hypothetical protein